MSVTINGTLFYANWCGHCQTFKPEWNKFKEMIAQQNENNKNMHITINEYEDSNLPTEGAKIQNKDIRGYPTVKITVRSGNNVTEYEYDGKRTAKDLYNHVTKEAIKNIK